MAKKDNKLNDGDFDPLEEIQKKFGEGAIIRGDTVVKNIEAIPSGSINLDIALGVGGFPRGRISEIFGPEASGKTTLALEVIAQAQILGGSAAFVDVEHALDFGYAENIGVNVDELAISQPSSGEEALEITEILCKSNRMDVVIVDSVAALVPQAELDGEYKDANIGAQAKLMSKACRRIKGIVNKGKTALIFINQMREKIGVMFGSPETTPGGRALKFYASVRVDLRRISSFGSTPKSSDKNVERDKEKVGNRVKANVIKNKVAPPFRKAEFDIIFGEGISRISEILDLGPECGILKKSGSWYSYNDIRIGNGKPVAVEFLKNNQDMYEEIAEAVLDQKLPLRKRRKDDDDDASATVEHQ